LLNDLEMWVWSKMVPMYWKNVNVRPEFKKGGRQNVRNERPVTVQSSLCSVATPTSSDSLLVTGGTDSQSAGIYKELLFQLSLRDRQLDLDPDL